MTIVQFTRFRTTPQRESAVLEARQASLRACRGAEPELCGAYLIHLADGEWLDIVMWDGRPDTDAFDDPAQAASRAAFYDQIDELLGEESGILVHQDAGPRFSAPSGPRTTRPDQVRPHLGDEHVAGRSGSRSCTSDASVPRD
jgi:quinol monooxygenase YgiN